MPATRRIDGYTDAEWVLVSRFTEEAKKLVRVDAKSSPNRQWKKFFEHIADNLTNPEVSVDSAKLAARLNTGSYSQRCLELTGKRPKDYIDYHRIRLAQKINRHTDALIGKIASSLGFDDSRSFSRLYSRIIGHPPSEEDKAEGSESLDPRNSPNTPEVPLDAPRNLDLNRFWHQVRKYDREQINGFAFQNRRSLGKGHFYLLLERAKYEGRIDREKGEELILAALDVIRLVEYCEGADLQDEKALGYAHLANACRLLFRFPDSAEWFAVADRYLPRSRQENPLLYCQVHFLRVSLLWWQEKREEAIDLLIDLLPDIRRYGPRQLLARALILGGDIYDSMGWTDHALPLLSEAIALTNTIDDTYVIFTAHFNITHLYASAGLGKEAEQYYLEVKRLHEAIEVVVSNGLVFYLGGLVCKANQDLLQAESLFRKAHTRFLEDNLEIYAALVSLHLSFLCLELGNANDAFKLAISVIPIVTQFSKHREVISAIAVLQEARRLKSVDKSIVAAALNHLELVRRDPTANYLSSRAG